MRRRLKDFRRLWSGMKAQQTRDLWDSEQQYQHELARIEPLSAS